MNVRKRDKKKFVRQDLHLRNLQVSDSEDFEDTLTSDERRAEKKTVAKGENSQKSDLILKRGRVLEVHSNHICKVDVEGEDLLCTVGGRLKNINFTTRTLIAVGDYVHVDVSHEPRLEEVLPRDNALSRFTETEFQAEDIIAANVDQVLITASCADPEFKPGLIDRYLCAARIAGIDALLCLNKLDLLADFDGQSVPEVAHEVCRFYTDLEIPVFFTSARAKFGLEPLIERLRGRETVFSGHSGVGKTALIDCIQPGVAGKTQAVSEATGKGRHSTTFSRLIRWDFGGYLVDTPGIRTFGLRRRDRSLLPRIFPGFEELYLQCRFADCSHSHEGDCAVKAAVEAGNFDEEHYQSYLRIWESLQ